MNVVRLNGIRLAYREIGTGPAVLFLHGFPQSSRLWDRVVPVLADEWRLILPDLRGMGETQPTSHATLSDYADDAAALLDHLGLSSAVVVGLSMGGHVAFELHRRHPDRIRALVLADSRADLDPPSAIQDRLTMATATLEHGPAAFVEAMLPRLFDPSAPQELRDEWRDIMMSTPREGIAAGLRALAARPDSRPTLARISVPTRVIVGASDQLTPVSCAHEIAHGIAGATLTIIPDAGHMTPVEQPGPFAHAVTTFLRQPALV